MLDSSNKFLSYEDRLSAMEHLLAKIYELLADERTFKEWYTVREVAKLLKKSEFTVREWCRLGRVFANKRACGRGNKKEWIVSHEELQRIRNEGLLPTQ